MCPGITSKGFDFSIQQGPFAWDIAGGSLVFLAWETVIYFALTVLTEYGLTFPVLASWIYSYGIRDHGAGVIDDEDEDVLAERERVLSGRANDNIVCLKELRKVYWTTIDGCFDWLMCFQ